MSITMVHAVMSGHWRHPGMVFVAFVSTDVQIENRHGAYLHQAELPADILPAIIAPEMDAEIRPDIATSPD